MSIYFRAKMDAIDHYSQFPVVKGELLTPSERYSVARYIDDSIFDVVEISQKKTYKYFGTRFEIKE